MTDPIIVCAANRFKLEEDSGFDLDYVVLVGPRHWDETMHHQYDNLDITLEENIDRSTEEQGFIDQFGKFYNRKEAYLIAENQGQIKHKVGGPRGTLFSEHLY